MRTVYALIVLAVMTGGVMAAQAPSDAAADAQKNPALPPAPPPPLYVPDRDPNRARPLSEEEVERLLLAMRRDVAAQPGGAGQTEPTDEFKPISEVPPEDRLPAAPMLVGAYAFVMLALFAYLVSLSRRLNAVARDLAKFESQSKRP